MQHLKIELNFFSSLKKVNKLLLCEYMIFRWRYHQYGRYWYIGMARAPYALYKCAREKVSQN